MCWWKPLDVFVVRNRLVLESARQEVTDPSLIDSSRNAREGKQCLEFGCKRERGIGLMVIKRFDADVVARTEQA